MSVGIEKDVLRFEISVHDAVVVEMLKRENKLGDVELGAVLLEFAFLLKMPEELTTGHVVGDEVEIRRRLEGELEPHDEGRVRRRCPHKDIALSYRVCNFLLLDNDLLGQHLHGVDTTGILLAHLVDLTESTLFASVPHGLETEEVPITHPCR